MWWPPAISIYLPFLLITLQGSFVYSQSCGYVYSQQKISSTEGGLVGPLANSELFGGAVASIGDLDGDGVPDIAVGSRSNDGGTNRGAVYILFLDTDMTVKSEQKISDIAGGFGGTLNDFDLFGHCIASMGDLDSDGVSELVVGAVYDDDGGTNRGAVWILFMNTDGTVKSEQKISDLAGGFTGVLNDNDEFGVSVAALGDMDSDGVPDLAISAHNDDDGGTNRGAVYILFLNSDGTVKSHQKISDTAGGFTGSLADDDIFGSGIGNIGDLDGDGVIDLAVSAVGDDGLGTDRGAVYILFMNSDGTVKGHQKIGESDGSYGLLIQCIRLSELYKYIYNRPLGRI